MYGIIWRWLFALGFVFWASLCANDYYTKNVQKHVDTIESVNLDIIDTTVPILLTKNEVATSFSFWKFFMSVISVGAVVFIKWLARPRQNKILMLTNNKVDDVLDAIGSTYEIPASLTQSSDTKLKLVTCLNSDNSDSSDLTNNLELKNKYGFNADFIYTPALSQINKTIPTTVTGVKVIQKKLEDLENNVATLKQKFNNNQNGIVSSSRAFQSFLNSNLKSVKKNIKLAVENTIPSASNSYAILANVKKTKSNKNIYKRAITSASRKKSNISITVSSNNLKQESKYIHVTQSKSKMSINDSSSCDENRKDFRILFHSKSEVCNSISTDSVNINKSDEEFTSNSDLSEVCQDLEKTDEKFHKLTKKFLMNSNETLNVSDEIDNNGSSFNLDYVTPSEMNQFLSVEKYINLDINNIDSDNLSSKQNHKTFTFSQADQLSTDSMYLKSNSTDTDYSFKSNTLFSQYKHYQPTGTLDSGCTLHDSTNINKKFSNVFW